jgi:oxazoline/thiazoline synthase
MTVAEGERYVAFKRHVTTAVVPNEAAYLVSARGVTALRGRHAAVLAPLLDGSRTVDMVVHDAASAFPADEVRYVLHQLASANLLTLRSSLGPVPPEDAAAEAYWDLSGLDGTSVLAHVRARPVELVVLGSVDPAPWQQLALASGLELRRGDPAGTPRARCALTLVLCEDYLDPELARVDESHRKAGRAWLLAKPLGHEPWIGPVFGPEEAPCWHCLAHRLRGHRRSSLPADRSADVVRLVPETSIAATRSMAQNLVILEAAKWIAGLRHDGRDCVFTFDTLTLNSERHPVTRRPQCPVCGDPGLVAARVAVPPVLGSRPKAGAGGTGERAVAPEVLLERHAALLGPVTGIAKEISRARGVPEFVHSYTSGPNLALRASTLAPVSLHSVLRGHSGGKGTTAAAARMGALAEAVERYSAVRQGDEPTVTGSYRELAEKAVHPDTLQLYDRRQFRDRERWNASRSEAHWVCEPFSAEAPREWTPVWSLTAGGQRLVPTALMYLHHGRVGASAELLADSNGNAAGSCLEEAIIQGFLELVERDATAIWWYNRTVQPGLDLASFEEPWLERTLADYGRIGRRVWALDLTSDLGIPVVAAFSARTDGGPSRPAFGLGAHFDPRIALRRALTEMGQLFGSVLVAPPAGPDEAVEPDLLAWWRAADELAPAYLSPAAGPGRAESSYGYKPRSDQYEDIEAIMRLCRAHELDLMVLDQTRPDIGLPVVKVMVPGLRPLRARFAPGRLFDVPVRLGRLAGPTPYRELNPIPVFV